MKFFSWGVWVIFLGVYLTYYGFPSFLETKNRDLLSGFTWNSYGICVDSRGIRVELNVSRFSIEARGSNFVRYI